MTPHVPPPTTSLCVTGDTLASAQVAVHDGRGELDHPITVIRLADGAVVLQSHDLAPEAFVLALHDLGVRVVAARHTYDQALIESGRTA